MSSTPAQRFECPRCRTSYDEISRYCRECGADMAKPGPPGAAGPASISSGSAAAAAEAAEAEAGAAAGRSADEGAPPTDRRLTDSNRTWLGKVVDGRYRVLEVIGRGGMGVVYRVEHLRMGKIAAMKVLHRDLAQDADVVGRFEREAAVISKLHHPHTVQVFDFGTAQGALYLIMEYVRGRDLARIIERDGPMRWARAAPLLAQICGALSEAHEAGIVHRDLKPENVLITRSTAGREYAKVLDFGLAKLDQRAAPKRETERQAIVGTPYFMAPEQIRGDAVDARTDLYSFGALMFELLTGQHLYSGSTAVGVLTKHLTAEPDAPSTRAPRLGIPPAVDGLCRKALQRDPDRRWQTAAELGAAIEEVYAETVGDASGPRTKVGVAIALDDSASSDLRLRRSDLDAFERGLRRRQAIVWTGTGLLAAGGAAAIALYVMRPPPTVTAEREPNDEPAQADRIALGVPVTGYLGKRRSPTEGDRDVYTLKLPGSGRRVVSVSVSGIPNLDLNLAIDNGARVDEGGVGEGEAVHRRAVEGRVTITIGQTMGKGPQLPVENVSDPYTLVVTEEAAEGGEIEPNNMEADATELAPGLVVRGYLDTRADVDLLRWTGGDGTFDVVVRADGVPLSWRVGDGARRTPGAAKVELRRGDLIRIERREPQPPGPLVGRDAPWSIVVPR
jgi:eukaryotic-like serine/threonine-protein kinase